MNRILVTGSKGIVGQKLVEQLKNFGNSVFGVDLLHHAGEKGFVQNMSSEKWTYSRCDIGEFRQIERIIEQAGPFDIVYNCAAEFGRWNGEDYFEQVWKSNLIGLKKYGVAHVLSIAVKILFFLAIEIIFDKSWNSKVLLPGFSTNINFVFLLIFSFKELIS